MALKEKLHWGRPNPHQGKYNTYDRFGVNCGSQNIINSNSLSVSNEPIRVIHFIALFDVTNVARDYFFDDQRGAGAGVDKCDVDGVIFILLDPLRIFMVPFVFFKFTFTPEFTFGLVYGCLLLF